MLQILVAVFKQTLIASNFNFSLVTVLEFIAVDLQRNKFCKAYNFATNLSAIKKLA